MGALQPLETHWYRFDAGHCYSYPVKSFTARGVWLSVPYHNDKHQRFVLREGRKRWACPTKREALISYLIRKERHLQFLKIKLSEIEAQAQWAALALKAPDLDHWLDHCPYGVTTLFEKSFEIA